MVMMKKITPPLLLCCVIPLLGHAEGLLAVDNPARNGQDKKVYTAVDAFEANDQVTMRQYGSEWLGNYSPRNGSNIGLLAARAETGVQWKGYRIGTLYRAEALVEANRDTSDLVRQYNSNSDYDVGRTFQLDYQIKGFEADGARLSKSIQFPLSGQWQMNLGLGLSYLRGKRIKLATASGQVLTINAKDFNAGVSLNESDSQVNVRDLAQFNAPFGRMAAPSGEGYALDTGMVLHDLASGASIELAVADLAGHINWKDVPNNATDYGTATKYYDSDGFVHFNPPATRTSSYQNLSQRLEPKLWLAANYPAGDFEWQGATSYTQGYWLPQAGVTYRINPRWAMKAEYDFRFNTIGLLLQHPWFYLGLRMDSTNLDTAKAYGLNGGVNVSF